MVFPSLVIISVIAAFLENFADNPYVIHAFNGIRVCVGVLILNAVIKLWKKCGQGFGMRGYCFDCTWYLRIYEHLPLLFGLLAGCFRIGPWFIHKERSGGRHE